MVVRHRMKKNPVTRVTVQHHITRVVWVTGFSIHTKQPTPILCSFSWIPSLFTVTLKLRSYLIISLKNNEFSRTEGKKFRFYSSSRPWRHQVMFTLVSNARNFAVKRCQNWQTSKLTKTHQKWHSSIVWELSYKPCVRWYSSCHSCGIHVRYARNVCLSCKNKKYT